MKFNNNKLLTNHLKSYELFITKAEKDFTQSFL